MKNAPGANRGRYQKGTAMPNSSTSIADPVPYSGRVRTRDPLTSFDAAEIDTADYDAVKGEIIAILRVGGPATDDDIYRDYRTTAMYSDQKLRSPSRIRTARKELHVAGIVRKFDERGVSLLGNRSTRWALNEGTR